MLLAGCLERSPPPPLQNNGTDTPVSPAPLKQTPGQAALAFVLRFFMRSMASAPQHARHTVSCTDACTEGAGRKGRKSEVGEILRGCTVNFLLIKMGVKRRRGGSVVIFEGLSVRAQEGVWGGGGQIK
ncbi:unnamed protein product [Gadus morhua 'NCC']